MPRVRWPIYVALTLGLAGCNLGGLSGLSELGDALGPSLTGIGVSGDSVVTFGDTVRLSAAGSVGGAIGFLSVDRLLDATWTSSDPNIATVEVRRPAATDSVSTTAAVVRGHRPGVVQITAAARQHSGRLSVRVVARPAP